MVYIIWVIKGPYYTHLCHSHFIVFWEPLVRYGTSRTRLKGPEVGVCENKTFSLGLGIGAKRTIFICNITYDISYVEPLYELYFLFCNNVV